MNTKEPQNTANAKNVGIFFVADGELLLHTCPLECGEQYGDFVNFKDSHMSVWDKNYRHKYKVDFDYYPRGRIVYRKTDDTFLIYKDKCIGDLFDKTLIDTCKGRCVFAEDEHYSCHKCLDVYYNLYEE